MKFTYKEKEYSLRYSFKALTAIEKELGISITKIETSNISMRFVLVIFWAGLKHVDSQITLDEAEDMLDTVEFEGNPIDQIVQTMMKDVGDFFGEKKAKKK